MLTLSLGPGAELRALEPWHAEEFLAHLDAAREHLRPWIPFASSVVDLPAAREFLQRYADRQAADTARLYGIWVEGRLSGGTLFKDVDARMGVAEIGVWLAPGAEGRGLITTAARHMIDWAFHVRGWHRVEWRNSTDNVRSRAVAKRLGLTHEGTLRGEPGWAHELTRSERAIRLARGPSRACGQRQPRSRSIRQHREPCRYDPTRRTWAGISTRSSWMGHPAAGRPMRGNPAGPLASMT